MADLLTAASPVPGVRAGTTSRPGTLTIDLAVTPQSLGIVRSIVGAHLRLWGVSNLEDIRDRMVLAIDELLANVLDHAVDPRDATAKNAKLLVLRIPDALVAVVTDADPTAPRESSDLDEASEDGRGLLLVKSVSDDFGVSVNKDGKDIWAKFLCPEPEAEAAERRRR
ncbi:ATP-binding protein [Streptomyces jumonjinensis]|uniref:ATP-binding protein n=1 Tax=Streptomyces jumonjinensis TaxID=1945 RepID=UPI003788C9D2